PLLLQTEVLHRAGRGDAVPPALAERVEVPGREEVEVRLRPPGEVLEDAARADRLRHRPEERPVPGADRLLPRNAPLELAPEEVAVDGDVLEHLGVVARVG